MMMEELFAAARAQPAPLPQALRDAMEQDALAMMPRAKPRSLWQVIGGMWGASGLVTATLAGIWIGAVPMENTAVWADPVAYISGTGLSAESGADEDLAWAEISDDLGWSLDEGV